MTQNNLPSWKIDHPSNTRTIIPTSASDVIDNFNDTVYITIDQNSITKTYNKDLTLKQIETYYALQAWFRNYLSQLDTEFQVVDDPFNISIQDNFVRSILPLIKWENLSLLKADPTIGKIIYEINKFWYNYLDKLLLPENLKDCIQSIAPLNIIKNANDQYIVTDVGTNIKNLLPVLEYLKKTFN